MMNRLFRVIKSSAPKQELPPSLKTPRIITFTAILAQAMVNVGIEHYDEREKHAMEKEESHRPAVKQKV